MRYEVLDLRGRVRDSYRAPFDDDARARAELAGHAVLDVVRVQTSRRPSQPEQVRAVVVEP